MKIGRKNILQRDNNHFFFWLWISAILFLSITSTLYAKGLTLDEILRIGLQVNPEIRSLEERIEAAKGAVIQAGTAPNPDVNMRVEDISRAMGRQRPR